MADDELEDGEIPSYTMVGGQKVPIIPFGSERFLDETKSQELMNNAGFAFWIAWKRIAAAISKLEQTNPTALDIQAAQKATLTLMEMMEKLESGSFSMLVKPASASTPSDDDDDGDGMEGETAGGYIARIVNALKSTGDRDKTALRREHDRQIAGRETRTGKVPGRGRGRPRADASGQGRREDKDPAD